MIRAPSDPFPSLRAPAWARPPTAPAREIAGAEALYFAGAALVALDALVRQEAAFAGAWRQRLALKAAAASAKLLNRREDEAALRDALARPGPDLGPGGRLYAAWRALAQAGDPLRPERLAAVAADLQSPLSPPQVAALAAALRDAATSGRPAPTAAVAAAEAVLALRPDAEALALWAADAALAQSLRWPAALPLLAAEIGQRRYGGADGRRARPGEAGFAKIAALAYAHAAAAALALADELSRRTQTLLAAAPKLRAKGKQSALTALLEADAVAAAAPLAGLSERARRRLFDRLVALGAVRELTGRDTFKLYGL